MSTQQERTAFLREFGFNATHATTYANAYESVEAALEALIRDTANNRLLDAVPGASPAAAAAAVAAASQTANNNPVDLDERKETISEYLTPTEWMPIRRVNVTVIEYDSTSESEERDEERLEHALPSATDEIEFEVVHSAITPPSDTALREWTVRKLTRAFDSVALTDGGEMVDAHDCFDVASVTSKEGSRSNGGSECSTPRIHEEMTSGDPGICCFCLDKTPDTLLLPCRHLALCSCCALDYISRTREHNHLVQRIKLSHAEEQRVSRFIPSTQKTVERLCACPRCATEVKIAVRRRTNAME